ncbi:MAG: Transcriptional activator of maltose regulon, MalT [uncultured Thiotrichaceae bacterium]|uniref:Transcriptional activator of maltose regulon, MalT n=1 Tax=uncultured Thiotrichaceae bacterium TaxID=298394 RepID=A0A6S6TL12_9GAMM|nr:MAG: Transcriptional activator of maltose regulon, MalT [uncultured Thiotrichaceae bacterium]
MTPTLIATRFFIPPPRTNHVVRQRLQKRILQGLKKKLTLVSAPAGFGKTTLVSAALAAIDLDIAWVSLEESDNELHHFIRLLTTSLQKSRQQFGLATTTLLETSQPASTDALLITFLNELGELKAPMVLVLDDYHAIDSQAIDDALTFLVEHQPPALRLIMTTREDPALPLPRLRVRSELTEIRAADLRFTEKEASSFFKKTMGLTLNEQHIRALDKRTEGWIAGLQLAGLSLQTCDDNTGFIDAFTGSHRFIIDYLADEVLARQAESIQTFLVKTCILDRFNADLCDAITHQTHSANILHQLDHDNLFLVALDENREWYRYHHLFRDVLRAQLNLSDISQQDLHTDSSLWLKKRGYIPEAIQHALAAQQHQIAVATIEETWPDLRKEMPESHFIGWLERLPKEAILQSPILCSYYGVAMLSFDLDNAVVWLEAAEAWFEHNTEEDRQANTSARQTIINDLPGLLAIGRAYHSGAIGDPDGVIEHANRALELLDEREAVWRGSAAALRGLVQWGMGDLTAAAESINTAYHCMKKGEDTSGTISTAYLLANILIAQGKRKKAGHWCHKALSDIEALSFSPQGTADIYVTLAVLALGKYDIDTAHEYLETANKLGDEAKLLESAHHWFIAQALLESQKGNYQQAEDLLVEAQTVKIPSPSPDFAPIEAWQARLDLIQGRLNDALRWASSSGLSTEDEAVFALEFSHLTLIRVLIAQLREHHASKEMHHAQQFIQRLLAAATEQNRDGSLFEIHLLKALLQHTAGNEKAALHALQLAISLPDADRQAFRLKSEDRYSTEWFKTALGQIDTPEWINQLLKRSDQKKPPARQAQSHVKLVEALSDREREVLRMLHSELTGPEIADQLFVSLNTLRTHTKNIYSKLAVSNRRAAVRRSNELGLK